MAGDFGLSPADFNSCAVRASIPKAETRARGSRFEGPATVLGLKPTDRRDGANCSPGEGLGGGWSGLTPTSLEGASELRSEDVVAKVAALRCRRAVESGTGETDGAVAVVS